MDWSKLFPKYFKSPSTDSKTNGEDMETADSSNSQVEFLDVGCGYGGLLGTTCICSIGNLI